MIVGGASSAVYQVVPSRLQYGCTKRALGPIVRNVGYGAFQVIQAASAMNSLGATSGRQRVASLTYARSSLWMIR